MKQEVDAINKHTCIERIETTQRARADAGFVLLRRFDAFS